MKNIIVGTAGHIDHGKTTLVKALTGRETDTLSEEKQRGISINLGFTYLDLPNGNRIGIVDVPGHEKFVKNMMAGATGIDLVLFIIAADEGVMPQSKEHLDILTYLNIKKGIIVLTKCDLVEDDYLELVEDELKDFTKGTFLEGSEIVKVDSISKRGIDELINLLEKESEIIEEKESDVPERMHIDRAFPVKGIGTVITGTLMEGKVTRGDELFIYPVEEKVKVRSVQVHGEDVETAYAGQRTAINISTLKKNTISRGDIIAKEGSVVTTSIIDAKVMVSKNRDFSIKHWTRIRLALGTREILCRAVPLESEEILPGDEGFVQFRLEEPLVCRNRDRFVLRSYSPVETIGGGIIIDPLSKKRHVDDELIEKLRIKESGDLDKIILQFTETEDNLVELKDIISYTGESEVEVNKEITKLISESLILNIDKKYLNEKILGKIKANIKEVLEKHHKDNPLSLGFTKDELKTKINYDVSLKEMEIILDILISRDILRKNNDSYSLKEFNIGLSKKQEKMRKDIIGELKNNSFDKIETIKSFAGKDKEKEQILKYMINKDIVIFGDNNILLKEDYDKAVKLVKDYIEKNGNITISEYRDLLNSSRKNTLLLMDHFDSIKLTKRVDDSRILV
ncbi:selenocysteine-specific translation elongation factor [Miniphocaeibacter massiliensis]|uniref:selenocysteine-specific translation elongation factor n=1 Tax=Miniphocaeibacter massiliensis TaxID=2041841 RepID=UPI000C1BFA8B|nr:selenocysteine-specific translation elongation factor [Miniphocaeibacter massiliensis]